MLVTFKLSTILPILENCLNESKFIDSDKFTGADALVAEALGGAPPSEFKRLSEWYIEVKKDDEEAEAILDEDDIDLFGSDDDDVDEEAEKIKAQRLAEYQAKKATKPKTIAKTTITLDIKPWDDETDMEALTKAVKDIKMDGLLWGGSKLVAIGYGIKKLQINCVVEDDKVSMDDLSDKITDLEDYVQSIDVAAMQKI
ncbi:hypothetical protein CLU79DRAFT_743347 [Phycomyces nitens]|nr:hypothetical protein CLU79DRAFT_743347 [Phycomyces nitens]